MFNRNMKSDNATDFFQSDTRFD